MIYLLSCCTTDKLKCSKRSQFWRKSRDDTQVKWITISDYMTLTPKGTGKYQWDLIAQRARFSISTLIKIFCGLSHWKQSMKGGGKTQKLLRNPSSATSQERGEPTQKLIRSKDLTTTSSTEDICTGDRSLLMLINKALCNCFANRADRSGQDRNILTRTGPEQISWEPQGNGRACFCTSAHSA